MTVRTVVFDLGNVLIRWDPHPAIAVGVGGDEAARFLSADDFDFHAWNAEQDAGRPWPEAEETAIRHYPHWREHVLAYRTNFLASLTGPVPDTVAVLEELHTAGVPLYALTNWSTELFRLARPHFEFLELFDGIIVSGDEGLAKPDGAIFDVLQQRLGHDLADSVFIDDNRANVAAARAKSMDAILFTDTGHLRDDLVRRGLPLSSNTHS